MKAADMHCDTIGEIYEDRKKGGKASLRKNSFHLDLEKMEKGDYGLQNFAIYVNLKNTENPFRTAMEMVDLFYQETERNQDLIRVVRSYEEIEKNWREGRMSAMLTMEEGGVCLGDVGLLRNFYRLGVRMMTLTWNFPNELGYPNLVIKDGPKKGCYPDTDHGLTQKGMEFLEEMERMGMIIDISHLGDAGIRDVFAHPRRPLVASHSNARAVCGHTRNMRDDMIRLLADKGGVMGLNIGPDFLAEGSGGASRVEDMVRQILHIRKVGGSGVLALGSDFDGVRGDFEIAGPQDWPKLADALRKAGLPEEELEGMWWMNADRVLREALA